MFVHLLVVLLAVAAVSAGCGGGGEGASKDEFATKAASICADLYEKAQALEFISEQVYAQAEAGDVEAIKKLEAGFAKFVPMERAALDELRRLPRPEEDAEAIAKFLSAFEEVLTRAEGDLAALRARKVPPRFASMSERDKGSIDVVLAADPLGFDCTPPHAPPH